MPFWENMAVMVNGRVVSLGMANSSLPACWLASGSAIYLAVGWEFYPRQDWQLHTGDVTQQLTVRQLSNLIPYSADETLRLILGKFNSRRYRKIKRRCYTNLLYLAYAVQTKCLVLVSKGTYSMCGRQAGRLRSPFFWSCTQKGNKRPPASFQKGNNTAWKLEGNP